VPASDIHLDRKPEQELREIVMQERRDRHALVSAFLGHAVRQRPQYLFAVLQFLVRLFESLAAEEHLPRKKERKDEDWDDPPGMLRLGKEGGKHEPKDRETKIANDKLAQTSDTKLTNDSDRAGSIVDACDYRNDSEIDQIVDNGREECSADQDNYRGALNFFDD